MMVFQEQVWMSWTEKEGWSTWGQTDAELYVGEDLSSP